MLCNVYTNRANGPYGICSYEYDAEKRLRYKEVSPRNAPAALPQLHLQRLEPPLRNTDH